MVVTCVQADRNDLNTINSLMHRSKAYWGYDDGFMDKFMQLFQMTPEYLEKNTVKLFWTLDPQGDKAIGFYSFNINTKEAELDNFFIDPDYIGKGFGKKMWSIMINDFQSYGVNKFQGNRILN